jgi:hypothetical protein
MPKYEAIPARATPRIARYAEWVKPPRVGKSIGLVWLPL